MEWFHISPHLIIPTILWDRYHHCFQFTDNKLAQPPLMAPSQMLLKQGEFYSGSVLFRTMQNKNNPTGSEKCYPKIKHRVIDIIREMLKIHLIFLNAYNLCNK